MLAVLNYQDFDIGILLTTNQTIHKYNRDYRDKDIGIIAISANDAEEYPDDALDCYVAHDPNPNNAPYEDAVDIVERIRWLVPMHPSEER